MDPVQPFVLGHKSSFDVWPFNEGQEVGTFFVGVAHDLGIIIHVCESFELYQEVNCSVLVAIEFGGGNPFEASSLSLGFFVQVVDGKGIVSVSLWGSSSIPSSSSCGLGGEQL